MLTSWATLVGHFGRGKGPRIEADPKATTTENWAGTMRAVVAFATLFGGTLAGYAGLYAMLNTLIKG